ncbi:MAG: hypothetical protein ACKVJE_12400 [Pseudomonadales bacterium]|jgi:hypothetical protein
MKLLANMAVPVAFLMASIFAYLVLSNSLKSDDLKHEGLIVKLEEQIAQDPIKARVLGLHLQLKAQKHLQESESQLLLAMWQLLVEGAIALFLLSLSWQYYVHHKTNGNS